VGYVFARLTAILVWMLSKSYARHFIA